MFSLRPVSILAHIPLGIGLKWKYVMVCTYQYFSASQIEYQWDVKIP